MKKHKQANKNSLKTDRRQAFEEYFAGLYGERWPSLKAALEKDSEQVTLVNPFGKEWQDYRLDPASLLPAKFLEARPGQSIADFCASPGGKSLAMIFALNGQEAKWFCNDLSPNRAQRLKAVLHDCLPPEILKQIHVTKSDASRWGLSRKGHFDRILVDAPCSGERHLLSNPQELSRWSLKGAKRLVLRQHSLLCSAMDSLDFGGRLVYSTCSINPMENDGVIERLMKSRPGQFQVAPIVAAPGEVLLGEPTKHGRMILPDLSQYGPIYFCVMEKLS